MNQWSSIVKKTVFRHWACLFCCTLIMLTSTRAWAARPIPYSPLNLPKLTKGEAPSEATEAYPDAPVVSSVNPDYGPRHGWTLVELKGKNFKKGLEVLVGGKEAFDVEFLSNTRLRARTPENTFLGSADVVIRNPDGKAGGILNGFLYEGGIFEAPGYNVPPDWHWATCIRLVDMNKDGKRDFLMAKPWKPLDDKELGNLVIYLQGPDRDGDGVPNFEPVRRSQALNDTKNHYTSLEAADLDKDGDMDFVATGRVEWYLFAMRNQINRVFLNDGNCNFTVKDLPGNAMSKGVDIGDVNGDGNPDIVIANMGAQNQLFFGDGNGNFRDVTQTHLPKAVMQTTHIHLVDVDGDRDLDAVAANTSPPKQKKGGAPNHLYINDGKGHFSNETGERQFPAGDQDTFRVASADMDKDGDMDLVLANKGMNQLLVNGGNGRFQVRPMPAYQIEDRWTGATRDVSKARNLDVHFTDISGDGYPDVVFCSNACSAMVYMNVPDANGHRAFKAKPDILEPKPMGHGAESIHLADVDGDGKPDLTIASGHEQTPLWINDWPKGFRFATCNTKLNLPYTDWVVLSCGVGDVNGDGKPDIAMGQRLEKDVMLFLQGSNGWTMKSVPAPGVLIPGQSIVEDVALVDVDGDKDGDIVLGIRGKPSALLLNDGKANFEVAKGQRALPPTPMSTSKILPVDVDLDGDQDLVMCNWERRLLAAGKQKNSLFINNGKGIFEDKSKEYLPKVKSTARGGDVGDVNGDGYPDIVLACIRSTPLAGPMENHLYLNQGKKAPGRFTNATHLLPPNNRKSTDAAFLDVDGDGRLDIVFVNEVDMKGKGGEDELYRQKKDGTFENWSNRLPTISRLSWDVQVVDFNLDKLPDIFTTRAYWNYGGVFGPKEEHGRLLLLANDGTGRYSYPTIRQFQYIDKELDSWTGSCTYDLNQDGYDEIVECVDGQVRFFQTFLRTKAVAHPVYAEGPVGQAIQFDASSTNFPWGLKAQSFTWEFGDGKKGTGQKVSHTYARGGTYTVKLSVTDTAGRKDEDRVTVIVK
jgi:hypothetical protein